MVFVPHVLSTSYRTCSIPYGFSIRCIQSEDTSWSLIAFADSTVHRNTQGHACYQSAIIANSFLFLTRPKWLYACAINKKQIGTVDHFLKSMLKLCKHCKTNDGTFWNHKYVLLPYRWNRNPHAHIHKFLFPHEEKHIVETRLKTNSISFRRLAKRSFEIIVWSKLN